MKLSAEASEYLGQFDAELLQIPEGRRILTRVNPRLFAIVYLNHHLAGDETEDVVSFSEAHLDWYERMLAFVSPITEPKSWRRAQIAPRNSAKSTVWFLIAPMWAAAHGHVEFVAAFADSASQAEGHLTTFKHELDTNELLRRDYPELCAPMIRRRGTTVADNRGMMQQRSGFIFAARGIDSAILGMKVGEKRPDLIVLDDIEPDESSYSPYQMTKRLATLTDAILPLNDWARVVLVGTVTMEGSIIHQLVKTRTSTEEPPSWIADERFEVDYYPALLLNDDGTERSLWPEKWSLDYLTGMRHTRTFAKNYQNLPIGIDGVMWDQTDIVVDDPGPDVLARCRHMLSVDPATTTKTSSDYTGLAVLSHDKAAGVVYVRDVWRVRLVGAPLRHRVAAILQTYPEVTVIYCEINQGGDLWSEVFEPLGLRYTTKHQTVKKEVRAGWLLNAYQRRQVKHTKRLPEYESELLGYPNVLNDDQVDAVGTGTTVMLGLGSPVRDTLRRRVA